MVTIYKQERIDKLFEIGMQLLKECPTLDVDRILFNGVCDEAEFKRLVLHQKIGKLVEYASGATFDQPLVQNLGSIDDPHSLLQTYVAGPFTAKDLWHQHLNSTEGECHAAIVAKLGLNPFCPHKNTEHFMGIQTPEYWYRATLESMMRCDLVYITTFIGKDRKVSRGTLSEALYANDHCMPLVFKDTAGLVDALDVWRHEGGQL